MPMSNLLGPSSSMPSFRVPAAQERNGWPNDFCGSRGDHSQSSRAGGFSRAPADRFGRERKPNRPGGSLPARGETARESRFRRNYGRTIRSPHPGGPRPESALEPGVLRLVLGAGGLPGVTVDYRRFPFGYRGLLLG